MQMGLGKTLCAASVVAATLRAQRASHTATLYVCPRHLLLEVRDDIRKFFGCGLRVAIYHLAESVLAYKRIERRGFGAHDVVLTSYDTLVRRSETSPVFRAARWFRVVLDESHQIRDRSSRRFRSVMGLCSPRRLCLSGTPVHRAPSDLMAQLEFCGISFPRGRRWDRPAALVQHGLLDLVHFVDYPSHSSPVVVNHTFRVHPAGPPLPGCLARILASVEAGTKVVVFAARDDILQLAREALDPARRSAHLGGTARSLYQRARVLQRFRTDPACSVLFTTYSAGAYGLNLPEADHIVFLQPPPCAATRRQAVSRAVRVHRRRELHVHEVLVDSPFPGAVGTPPGVRTTGCVPQRN
jgi:SNF2 family DNA or RNA helicase